MGTLKIVLFVIVMLMSGCTIKGIVTTGADCLTNILRDRDDFFCNNKGLRAWNERESFLNEVDPQGNWKYYEKDLNSGMIYDTRMGRKCPRNSWQHWCLKSWHEEHAWRNIPSTVTPLPKNDDKCEFTCDSQNGRFEQVKELFKL
jgi:hypothetical protein